MAPREDPAGHCRLCGRESAEGCAAEDPTCVERWRARCTGPGDHRRCHLFEDAYYCEFTDWWWEPILSLAREGLEEAGLNSEDAGAIVSVWNNEATLHRVSATYRPLRETWHSVQRTVRPASGPSSPRCHLLRVPEPQRASWLRDPPPPGRASSSRMSTLLLIWKSRVPRARGGKTQPAEPADPSMQGKCIVDLKPTVVNPGHRGRESVAGQPHEGCLLTPWHERPPRIGRQTRRATTDTERLTSGGTWCR